MEFEVPDAVGGSSSRVKPASKGEWELNELAEKGREGITRRIWDACEPDEDVGKGWRGQLGGAKRKAG